MNADDNLVIFGINISAGENAIIVYETRVNSFAPLAEDSTIVNTVNISGNCIASFESIWEFSKISSQILVDGAIFVQNSTIGD